MVIVVKIFKTEKTIEIHLVRLTEECAKVLSEKYAYKSVKTVLLLSNVVVFFAVFFFLLLLFKASQYNMFFQPSFN